MAIPPWLLGKHTTTLAVQPIVVSNTATGATTNSSTASQSLVGVVDQVAYRGNTTSENIVAMTAARDNEVPLEVDDTIEITEILQTAAASSLLAKCWQTADNADYAIVTLVRGPNQFVFTGLMESYTETINKGKSTARMVFRQANLGNVNPNPAITTP
jgi:hypothetical protein